LSILEKALFDTNYNTIRNFLEDSSNHINKNGKILLGFSSDFGNLNKLKQIIKKNNSKLRSKKNIKTKRNNINIRLQIYEIILN
jgi:hypothetical protein